MSCTIRVTVIRRINPKDTSRVDALLDKELQFQGALMNWDRHCFSLFSRDEAIDPPQAQSHLVTPFGEFWIKETVEQVYAQLKMASAGLHRYMGEANG